MTSWAVHHGNARELDAMTETLNAEIGVAWRALHAARMRVRTSQWAPALRSASARELRAAIVLNTLLRIRKAGRVAGRAAS